MPINDRFTSENPYVLTVQLQTADNNQAALNASLAETQGVIATSATTQSLGLNGALGSTVTQAVAGAAEGTVGTALAGLGDTVLTPSCFVYDTPVLMADGSSKMIGEIRVGRDSVKAFDHDGAIFNAKVIGKWEHLVPEYMEVHFKDGRVTKTTDCHRYWLKSDAFVPIKDIPQVQHWDGREWSGVNVTARRVLRPLQGVFVYNLTVETYHTYFANGHAVSNLKPAEDPTV